MKNYLLVITAGGIGKRFNKPYPKQLETIQNVPILLKTAKFFEKIPPIHCVVTYPDGFLKEFQKALNTVNYNMSFVKGGAERSYSVRNAIKFFLSENYSKDMVTLIHDGVRPFLNIETVNFVIDKTKEFNAAVPYIPLSGTLRKLKNKNFNETIDRENTVTVTTPQGCKLGILEDCFNKSNKNFSDESTLLSHFNIEQYPVNDWQLNLKITEQNDIKSAEILWKYIK